MKLQDNYMTPEVEVVQINMKSTILTSSAADPFGFYTDELTEETW